MPVVVVSGITRKGRRHHNPCVGAGAVDCYAKPDGSVNALLENDGGTLAQMVRDAARVRFVRVQTKPTVPVSPVAQQTIVASRSGPHRSTKLIAIGASTGGEALHNLLPAFPKTCPPTLIVQHISAAFAPAMASA